MSKKLLLLLLCVPMITLSQQTYVPDDNFENYLETNGMGNGIPNDDYVTTANINAITSLGIFSLNISDLTGIEDFTTLTNLYCGENQLTSLNVSNNTNLNELDCHNNLLTNLDLSGSTSLTYLSCNDNQLTILDLNNNTQLSSLLCYDNLLTELDVSNHFPLEVLSCSDNHLTNLDIRYMNYMDMYLLANNNPYLYCIDVDDVTLPTVNWTVSNGNIDAQHYFSTNCSGPTSTQEQTTNKELLKVTDILGRDTTPKRNKILFYIYNDGIVEKKIIIE